MSETRKSGWLDKLPAAVVVIEELRAHGCSDCSGAGVADTSYRCRRCRILIAFADALHEQSPSSRVPSAERSQSDA